MQIMWNWMMDLLVGSLLFLCVSDSVTCIIIHQKGIEKHHQASKVSATLQEKNGILQANHGH